jgi:hypothetical protein
MSDKAAEQPCERCGHRLDAHMVAGELRTGPCRATGCNCPMPRPPAAPGRPVTGGPGDDTPTTPGSRPQPTAGDYDTAVRVLGYDEWDYRQVASSVRSDVDAVAHALAAERQRAIAPFLALADELDAEARRRVDGLLVNEARDRRPIHAIADRIRGVASNSDGGLR